MLQSKADFTVPHSKNILTKTLRVNKICHEKFSQKIFSFGIDVKLYIEKPTQPKRLTVWCGFWFRGIIGPFYFENKQIEAVTFNGDRYRAMLKEFLFTKIEEEDIGNI